MVVKCFIAVGMSVANFTVAAVLYETTHNPEGMVSRWFHDSWIKAIVEKIWQRILGKKDDVGDT